MDKHLHFSRREREIMDILYAHGEASANAVTEVMTDPPCRDAVRTLLRILEEKGHVKHYKRGKEFIFLPTRPAKQAAQSALQRVLTTFFGGSIQKAVAAHLADQGTKVPKDELKRLSQLVREAREKGR